MYLLKQSFLITAIAFVVTILPLPCTLSEEETNETLKYVMSKYEELEMKLIGQPISIYGLRLSYGDDEEELNIHFKYVDNTQQDIIQNCVFVLYHRQNECELIKTICNTFLPFTPRPILKRKDLRICNDYSDVELVEEEDLGAEETTLMATTDIIQVFHNADVDISKYSHAGSADADDGNEETKQRSTEIGKE